MFVGEQGSLPLQLGTLRRFTREHQNFADKRSSLFCSLRQKTGLTTLTEEQHE